MSPETFLDIRVGSRYQSGKVPGTNYQYSYLVKSPDPSVPFVPQNQRGVQLWKVLPRPYPHVFCRATFISVLAFLNSIKVIIYKLITIIEINACKKLYFLMRTHGYLLNTRHLGGILIKCSLTFCSDTYAYCYVWYSDVFFPFSLLCPNKYYWSYNM